ncbi:hypothetical protein C0J08_14985 [Marinomonas sp. CT5]|uniref:hypothetical protein n=1 Tax=Marinomonas sp. CT5 TaxID=2066133 RepID=UPI001BAFC63E|nr:hypothetical protein [Marinomonas sp. CT5]QUX96624.1 hypothetical protein C0J08_14985 [Marinomonas sp. CT5]
MSAKKYTKTALGSLTEDELIQIGADDFNLELDEEMSKDDMVEEIWEAIKASKESEKDANESLKATPNDQKEKVEIEVAKGGENEPDYVTPAINGKVWRIKRGEKVMVPKFVARHLQSLSNTIYKEVKDSNGKVIARKAEEVKRFNVQVSI